MTILQIAGLRMRYKAEGDPSRPCLLMSNSLGTDLGMWDAQAAALSRDFHVLRYDTRGHGSSGNGGTPVSLELLGRDALALIDALGISRVHFCGISMGGLIGQWLAVHQPQRIARLVIANTAARIGSAEGWAARAAQVRGDGMKAIADGAAARWFTPAFAAGAPATVAHMIGRLREQDAHGYAACCDALAAADLRHAIGAITAPTLVIAGLHDPVTTVADGAWMAGRIAGARLRTLAASHLSNIEAAPQFSEALSQFLAD
ncbi:3-oxoadipate enol-lactonase [Rugamonas sp. A1-17]|nr:3-oxoadipate enol-lactonase [Rugamonas sp. A1-17]